MILLSIILWFATGVLLGLSLLAAWWYKFWVFEIVGTAYLWFSGTTLLLLLSLLLVKSLRRKRWLQVVLALTLVFYAESIPLLLP